MSLLIRVLILLLGPHLMTLSNPNYSQRPHLQIPPNWELRLQYISLGVALVAQRVKNLLAVQKTQV